jgi:nucleoside-diphosphate-sugar epimerase
MVLGAAGKIGPTLARMAKRAIDAAGAAKTVYAVDLAPLPKLAAEGVETIQCDLLDPEAVAALPRAANVVYMAGRKFGSTGAEHLTWAANVVVPYNAARAFADSRMVMFSTGCVYPIVHVSTGGATERTPPAPVGEYAMSCLGRERMFDYVSRTCGQRVLQFRLNYAVELRYGVLVDVARKVFRGEAVDVTTGHANVLWQGDVCERALLCLKLAASPPRALNVTGPETLSIRETAEAFGRLFGKPATFTGEENGMAYLSNAAESMALFGPPSVPPERVIQWTAHWIEIGGEDLGKPTHFETQDGRF